MERVFVSYRRDDTAREAHVLKVLLEERLRDIAVFVDTENIPGGVAWPERLRNELAQAAAVIALIGPDWRRGDGGRDRLVDEDDWVRQELEIGLASKPDGLLPIIVEDGKRLLDDLPPSLAALAERQSLPLTSERWTDDVAAIARWVVTAVGGDAKPVGDAFPAPDELKKLFPALEVDQLDRMLASGGMSDWASRAVVLPDVPDGGRELFKVFELKNFKQAFRFMSMVALEAERMNHHPDWRNVWNRVFVSQRTWDAGHVITLLDCQLAAFMNKKAAEVTDADDVDWPL